VAVEVSMSGVPGESALAGWTLLGDGELLEPAGAVSDGACDRTTTVPADTEVLHCVVRFPAADTTQYVAYQRGGELRRWAP
jgi:hypothetical protein